MQSKSRLAFNGAASDVISMPSEGLTFLIRTDARFATDGFRKNLLAAIQQNSAGASFNPRAAGLTNGSDVECAIKQSVHEAYQEWGHTVLDSISRHVNYDIYGIDETVRRLNVDFHNAYVLAEKIADNADEFLKKQPDYNVDAPVVYVSLDEMFHQCRSSWGEIAFSRLFSLKGDQQFGYTARPGKQPIEDQVEAFAQQVKDLRDLKGQDVKIVILEDNVRHAKMLNWVIDLMDKHHVFDHGKLACISTCFCSASPEERQAIVYQGQSIPMVAAVEYQSKSFEVSTPRDLLFDGYVVEVDGETTRLPGLFMDVEKLFKVCPEKVESFSEEIRGASLRFCERIEAEWGVKVPLSWFTGAKAIAAVTGKQPETRMADVLGDLDLQLNKVPAAVLQQNDPKNKPA